MCALVGWFGHPSEGFDVRCPRCGGRARFRTSEAVRLRHPEDEADRVLWYEWGVCQCDQCVGRFEHRLDWPRDAWWRVTVREGVLWAHTREQAVSLLAYVSADRREWDRSRQGWFLRHVPKEFLRVSARDRITRRLRELLEEGPRAGGGEDQGGGVRIAERHGSERGAVAVPEFGRRVPVG